MCEMCWLSIHQVSGHLQPSIKQPPVQDVTLILWLRRSSCSPERAQRRWSTIQSWFQATETTDVVREMEMGRDIRPRESKKTISPGRGQHQASGQGGVTRQARGDAHSSMRPQRRHGMAHQEEWGKRRRGKRTRQRGDKHQLQSTY